MNPHRKEVVRLIQSVGYRHDTYKLFSDFCELAALSLSNAADVRKREEREARYLTIVKGYEREVVELFPRIFAEVTLGLELEACDLLGGVFHDLELHNKQRGQFFTPFEVCRMMASMIVGDEAGVRQRIEQRGYLAACEPAVGAGAMVIALAEVIRGMGINYQRHLHVTAIDIDPRAVHMAYVQFSLLHIPAVIVVGNALTLEEREHWFTPAHVLGGWTARLQRDRPSELVEIEEVEAASAAAPALPVLPVAEVSRAGQLTLF
jgi:hypothetical protein